MSQIMTQLQEFTGQLQTELRAVKAQRDGLLAALEAVEWVIIVAPSGHQVTGCAWCKSPEYTGRHYAGCPRQAAIAKVRKEGCHVSAEGKALAPMPCGHSPACVRQDAEGTAYCEACEADAKADVAASADDTWKLQSLVVPTPKEPNMVSVYSPADCTMDLVSIDADGYTVKVTWREP